MQSSTSSANSRAVKGGGSKDEESKRHEIVTIALLPAGLPSPSISIYLIALFLILSVLTDLEVKGSPARMAVTLGKAVVSVMKR